MTDHRWEWRHQDDAEDDWKECGTARNTYEAAEQAADEWDCAMDRSLVISHGSTEFYIRDVTTGRVYDFKVHAEMRPRYTAVSLSEDH